MNKPTLGPQQELLEEERVVGKPVRSALADLGITRIFRRIAPAPDLTIDEILAMSEEEYAEAVWHPVTGLLVWKINHDSGKGRPLPQCPRVK
jgi:hypothetical protein